MRDTISRSAVRAAALPSLLAAQQTLDYQVLLSVPPGQQLPPIPYRSAFYTVGLCRAGSITLKADLAYYQLAPNSLVLLGPEVVRHWRHPSPDFQADSLSFTESFFTEPYTDPTRLRQFAGFHAQATRVLPLAASEANQMAELLTQVRQALRGPAARHQVEAVRSYVTLLLCLADTSYAQHPAIGPVLLHRVGLVTRFQQLLAQQTIPRRSVAACASLLCVTSKYLSEAVKEATGQTAGQWLTAQLLREARYLLGQPNRSIAEIAEALGFSDTSAFGKFFRRHTGQAAVSYRAAVGFHPPAATEL